VHRGPDAETACQPITDRPHPRKREVRDEGPLGTIQRDGHAERSGNRHDGRPDDEGVPRNPRTMNQGSPGVDKEQQSGEQVRVDGNHRADPVGDPPTRGGNLEGPEQEQ
jgi:hypothetical protein